MGPFLRQMGKGVPKGLGQARAVLELDPTLWGPLFPSGAKRADLAEPDPAWTPKGGPSARAWLELGVRRTPSSSQARAPRSRRRRGTRFMRKLFRACSKKFSMNLKHEASYFFTFFFKIFDGHLELFLCLSGETKIVPKGRFLFFPAKNTKIATNVHQNFKKKT